MLLCVALRRKVCKAGGEAAGNAPAPKASGWPRAKPEPRSGRKGPLASEERRTRSRKSDSLRNQR